MWCHQDGMMVASRVLAAHPAWAAWQGSNHLRVGGMRLACVAFSTFPGFGAGAALLNLQQFVCNCHILTPLHGDQQHI